MEKAKTKRNTKQATKTPKERKPKEASKLASKPAVSAHASSDQRKPHIQESKTGKSGLSAGKQGKYYESIGRRKTSVARVRLLPGGNDLLINGKNLEQYFLDFSLQRLIRDALSKIEEAKNFSVSVRVTGGGIHSQAQAIRHGIARALVLFNPDFKKKLKKSGFLTRDPRMRERKKFGLKRARRAPQWQKR